MGFTPIRVGLRGERISGPFKEPRGNCFHKGLDITSSRTPKQFKAGIFGRVISPIGGQWGTITISPFHSPSTVVQFLHCSAIYVGVGSIVAPWTILGRTGDVAPPNSGITGIHLHIQVVRPGSSTIACWGSRNFVDPQSWPTPDALAGDWEWKWKKGVFGDVVKSANRILSLSGSDVGSFASIDGQDLYVNNYSGETYSCSGGWYSGNVSSQAGNGISIKLAPGVCSCTNGGQCIAVSSPFQCYMLDMNTINITTTGAPFRANRVSGFIPPTQILSSSDLGKMDQLACIVAMSEESDLYSTAAPKDGVTIEEWYGVVKGERF